MPRRFCYLVTALAFCVSCTVAQSEVFTIPGEHLYTLHYYWTSHQVMIPLDTTMSDTALALREADTLWYNQLPFYIFTLPSTVTACTSFYLTAVAQNLTHDVRPGFNLRLFPLIVDDSITYEHAHHAFWVQFPLLDTVQFGDTNLYRTFGADSYNQFRLLRDHPDATHIVLWIQPSVSDTFRIISTTLIWSTGQTSVDRDPRIESEFTFYQNYPNPFNAETTIEFNLPMQTNLALRVYDLSGRVVRTVISWTMATGHHAVKLDMRNESSGIYFCSLDSQHGSRTRKLMLIK